jgi:hypothetical protein
MARKKYVAAVAVLGGAAAVTFAACSTNNPGTTPFMGSGSSGSGTGGSSSGAGSAGMSGGASGAGTGSTSESCGSPSLYRNDAGACICAGNAYRLSQDAGSCICEESLPTLCNYDAGQAPACVDTTTDPLNCGGCGLTCNPTAACNGSTCGKEPSNLVPAAAGCLSMHVVYDSGNIYWSDTGHGTIKSISTAGGAVTTVASGVQIAAVQSGTEGPLLWPNSSALSTGLLVHAGTVYWVGAATAVQCNDAGTCTGGGGTTIMSASAADAGAAPKTLLTMAMDPGPSPVSATDAMDPIEALGQNPPINAIALSPDASTLYFAAGTRFYSIPSSGAGTVTYVGYAEGPEHGEATALFADNANLYYPSNLSGNIEIFPFAHMCDPDAAINEMCPYRIAESQGSLVYDTITAKGGFVYWGNGSSVHVGDVSQAISGSIGGTDYPGSVSQTTITGFVVGTQNAYFGEPGSDNAGYIEKGASPPYDGTTPNAIVIARGQPSPTSFAIDGTNVYWTTSNCDINYIADSPQ